jgi:hypothetical protein
MNGAQSKRWALFAASARLASTGNPVANKFCVWQQGNTTFLKNTSSAYTFGVGFYVPQTASTGTASGTQISYRLAGRGYQFEITIGVMIVIGRACPSS